MHTYLFLILFLTSFSLFCTSSLPPHNPSNPIIISPVHAPDNSEKNIEKEETNLSEEEIKEMELVFKQSPIEAQLIVNHLQDPTFFTANEEYRATFFTGEPGCGKTTMAQAIGYRMKQHGWNYVFISSTSLLRDYRNQTTTQLNKVLQAAVSSSKPTIIVIDELNRLLENADSKHHDTDTTGADLWMFLDKQRKNPNFFFIGTMNRITKLPKPLKSRVLSDYIEFEMINDIAIQSAFFRECLTPKKSHLDNDITDKFLTEELQKINLYSFRDIKKTAAAIHRLQRQTTPPKDGALIIKKETITKTIDQHKQRKEKIQYDFEDETDEQRQERYHKENQSMQQALFAQQQMIQVALSNNQATVTRLDGSEHYITGEGKKIIYSLISDEQKKLYEDLMKPTNNRKEQEVAAQKAAEEKAIAEKAAADKIAAEEAAKNSWIARSLRMVGW